ncbi:hypothetical protein ACFSCX_13885 [Bacillus salitolerans]|uniref:Uncharacterized protein n=1 Tax=Bacillus salitolerans TaxID=1437434 RepID=A0ABW4LSI7_9BACI
MILTQPYIKTTRSIQLNKQVIKREEMVLELYRDKIKTNIEEFALQDVHDISFRSFTHNLGLLYLHTHRGVYSFEVEQNPSLFINTFREIVKRSPDENSHRG